MTIYLDLCKDFQNDLFGGCVTKSWRVKITFRDSMLLKWLNRAIINHCYLQSNEQLRIVWAVLPVWKFEHSNKAAKKARLQSIVVKNATGITCLDGNRLHSTFVYYIELL